MEKRMILKVPCGCGRNASMVGVIGIEPKKTAEELKKTVILYSSNLKFEEGLKKCICGKTVAVAEPGTFWGQ